MDAIEDTPPNKPVPNNVRSAYRNTPGGAYIISDSDDDVGQIGESDDSNTFSGERVRRRFALTQAQNGGPKEVRFACAYFDIALSLCIYKNLRGHCRSKFSMYSPFR